MLPMRRAYRILPVYTGDVSGACSALYELGGLTVMHDPSGCNSTYNTHDELRWYDKDSLIYISGLSEWDAMLGNDQKFVDDIVAEARRLHPKFVALASSPVAFMTGTDFPALAAIIEQKLGVPAFFVPTNGMHDYVSGAGAALEAVAKRLVVPAVRKAETAGDGARGRKTGTAGDGTRSREAETAEGHNKKVNLLGVTPLDFGTPSQVEKLRENLAAQGWEVNTVWAMGQTLEDLFHSDEASVNLVVSSVGLPAAKVLWEDLHIPYVVGTPLGTFSRTVCECLENVLRQEPRQGQQQRQQPRQEPDAPEVQDAPVAYFRDRLDAPAEITVIGEPVTAGSLAAFLERELKKAVRVLCPLEEWKGLLSENDLAVRGEEELEEALTGTKVLVADPLYRPVCPKGCRFVEMPHIAFSGRIYAEKLPDLNQITEEIGGTSWE